MRKIRRMRPWVQTRSIQPVVRADPLQAAYQHAEAGGVEELDRFHVDDEVVAAGLDEVDQLLPQLRRGVHVDLPADCDHGVVRRVGIHIEREIHAFFLSCCLGQ